MARPLRVEFPGALYHVISRGNERRPIVRDDEDRQRRLDWLRRTVQTYGWRLHAFVLMDNHEHLFVQTPEANLSAGMHDLNSSYTGYFNRRHHRVGHLFQGRFKGHLIEEEGYYLEISRYVHLNPARAKQVKRPEDYSWSSYPGYRWQSRRLDWVTYAAVLGEFGRDPTRARQGYRRFVEAGLTRPPPSPFAGALGGLLVGSRSFVDRIRQLLKTRSPDPDVTGLVQLRPRPPLDAIVAAVAEHFGVDRRLWGPGRRSDDVARAAAAYVARRKFGYPAGTVAIAVGYTNHSSVSRAVNRIESASAKFHESLASLARKLR